MALSTQTVLQDVSAGLALLVDWPFELGMSLPPSFPPSILEKLPSTSAAQKEEDEDKDEDGRGGVGLKVGFVGATDLTGWCNNVEVNYTLICATLTELKQTHAQVLLGVLNVVSATGVALVAPPDL